MEKSKIDFEKEFDLQEINQKPSEPKPLTEEQLREIQRYKEQVERTILFRKKTVKTMFNADFMPNQGEINNKPSLTIPDQTLPIRELLSRYAKGLPVGVKEPIYYGEDEFYPDPRTLDLVDIENMKEAVKEEIQELAKKVKPPKKQLETITDTQKPDDTKVSPEQKQPPKEETKPI